MRSESRMWHPAKGSTTQRAEDRIRTPRPLPCLSDPGGPCTPNPPDTELEASSIGAPELWAPPCCLNDRPTTTERDRHVRSPAGWRRSPVLSIQIRRPTRAIHYQRRPKEAPFSFTSARTIAAAQTAADRQHPLTAGCRARATRPSAPSRTATLAALLVAFSLSASVVPCGLDQGKHRQCRSQRPAHGSS